MRYLLGYKNNKSYIYVDPRPISSSADYDYQEDALPTTIYYVFLPDGDEFQDLIDNSDLLLSRSNQDIVLYVHTL